MGMNRNWTPEEKAYLADNWGSLSLPTLMKKLNRNKNAILIMVQRLKLGAFLESGEYVSFNQLLDAIGYGGGYSYKDKSWVENRGFPIKYKRVDKNRFKIVYIEDFWKWAEKNQEILNFANFEENSLGKEPGWVRDKRKRDFTYSRRINTDPWTQVEDEKLKKLLKLQKYGYHELSKLLGRTCGAIQRRCLDLNILDRPIKADNHNEWTSDEIDLLGSLIKKGYRYPDIADEVGKSDKAIRGLVFRNYCTENLDKVRTYIGNGLFGDNKPTKRLKDWNIMNGKERTEVRELIIRLAAILRFEYKQFFDECDFWQKDICQLWDGYCTAGENDCDSCTSFQRIQPQYCKRCGNTFYERHKELICMKCREQRIKQYLRKKAILTKGDAL